MTFLRLPARLAALVTLGALLVSCDTRMSTLNTAPGSSASSSVGPIVKILEPLPNALINVTDSVLTVRVRLTDLDAGVKNVTIQGVAIRGSAVLGTQTIVNRYVAVTAPPAGNFFPGPGGMDTVVTRLLRAVTPIDTSTKDSVTIIAVGTNMRNQVRADTVTVRLVNGPSIKFTAPAFDSVSKGQVVAVGLDAISPLIGVDSIGFTVTSTAAPPNGFPQSFGQSVSGRPAKFSYSAVFTVPQTATPGDVIIITPFARDANRQPGPSAALRLTVRSGLAPPPLVYQTVAPRVEVSDSISIAVTGTAIRTVGFEVLDSTGTVVGSGSRAVTDSTPNPYKLALNLGTTLQGKTLQLISYATDASSRTGWSLPAGAAVSQGNRALAFRTSFLVVYGRTFPLPLNRQGIIADIIADSRYGNVLLSNTTQGRLEVWHQVTGGGGAFDPNGVVVGSQPWGMAVARTNADTLYVANSGGTNLSRVFVGTATASAMREDIANRILTRISLLYKVTEQRDPLTGKIHITVFGPILFSDRPQYVQQSVSGRIYLSTKPTAASGMKGTVRWMEPAAAAPDQRFLLAFATRGTDPNSYLIANIDNATVAPSSANSTASDTLILCDHPSGTTSPMQCASSANGIGAAVAALRALVPTTDLDAQANLDENSLGLTDTTYAAASGDGQWIAFGEGHKAPFARAFLLRDDGTVPNSYTYASPALNILDLINNASDQVFGIALDKTGKTLGIHGAETYFASVTQPFTQRLQGKKSTFNQGAGIAFHPDADGTTTPQDKRLAFVASNNGSIEMVDIAYYDFNRGTLATKFNLYGPLRASPRFPNDDPAVLFKLFGVSSAGLVIIDVTANDILPGP